MGMQAGQELLALRLGKSEDGLHRGCTCLTQTEASLYHVALSPWCHGPRGGSHCCPPFTKQGRSSETPPQHQSSSGSWGEAGNFAVEAMFEWGLEASLDLGE